MVNRVLIRLKVVQTLYGYMLSRSEFKIETPIETSSPDRRYSYTAYSELLLLILILSGHKVTSNRQTPAAIVNAIKGTSFESSNVARFLASNEDVRNIIQQYADKMPAFDSAIPELVATLKKSPAYRKLAKSKDSTAKSTPSDEIEFWTAAARIMAKDPAVLEALRTNEDYTIRGMEMGVKMLVETLSNYSDTRNLLTNSKNNLRKSLDEAYDLYHWLLWLPIGIVNTEEARLESNASKFLPTEEDLHPDRRFVDSEFINRLRNNPALRKYIENKSVAWTDDIILMQRLVNIVINSTIYKEFMAAEGEKTIDEQCDLWRKLMKNVILPSDDLAEAMENQSIYWNDDLHVMSSFALKSLKQIASDENADLLPEFKDEEDAMFGSRLFDSVVSHREEYRSLIDEFINSSKWDTERIALMDVVILQTAIAEAIDFPNIPLTVTANEYVEIANWYSTQRAGSFVNGIFAAITEKLRNEGKIFKKFN